VPAPVTLRLGSALDPYGGGHNEGRRKHDHDNDLATHHNASSKQQGGPNKSAMKM